MDKISKLHAREILDSRGNPTVEADLFFSGDGKVSAIVPSGASTGDYEACELRDKESSRYLGKGVLKAVHAINEEIAKEFEGFVLGDQKKFDASLVSFDGSLNKSRLGANALLAVSIAYAKASAKAAGQELWEYFADLSGQKGTILPVPMMNILNGGVHADNNLDLQEIMIVPLGFEKFSESLRAGVEIFHHLKQVLREKSLNTSVGDEGGFAPNLGSNQEALDVISQAIEVAGYKVGEQIAFAIDAAASEFFQEGVYVLENETHSKKTSEEMISYYAALKNKYPIVALEDGLDQDDWEGWRKLNSQLGQDLQIIGDDLFVTNTKLLSKGISQKAANAVLIKMNQIGTITETLDCIAMAKKANFATVISHRSGESEDTTLADLAVGTDAGQIKTGSLCRTDRVAKYNQLLRIEEKLGKKAKFPGKKVFQR